MATARPAGSCPVQEAAHYLALQPNLILLELRGERIGLPGVREFWGCEGSGPARETPAGHVVAVKG